MREHSIVFKSLCHPFYNFALDVLFVWFGQPSIDCYLRPITEMIFSVYDNKYAGLLYLMACSVSCLCINKVSIDDFTVVKPCSFDKVVNLLIFLKVLLCKLKHYSISLFPYRF